MLGARGFSSEKFVGLVSGEAKAGASLSLPLTNILADMISLLKIPLPLCVQKEQLNLIASLSVRNTLREM